MSARFAAAALVFLAATPAGAFTIHLGGNPDLRGWPTKTLIIDVNYNEGSCDVTPDELDAAIDTALDLWNGVPSSGLKLARGSASSVDADQVVADIESGATTDRPVIICEPDFLSVTGADADSIAGVAGIGYGSDNVIRYGYLFLNSEDGDGANVGDFSALDLSFVVAHELGHVLGLGHSGDPNAVMYFSGNSARSSLRLSTDDMDGISYLYPRRELGENGLFGCGTVERPPGSPGGGAGGVLELTALLLCWFVYRQWRGKAYDS